MGIKVLPPDVNQSYHEFGVVPHTKDEPLQIRFGMDAIKNVGHGAVADIIRAREGGGQFTSIADFIARVNGRLVNKKVWESLAKAGAFDRFADRGAILENLDTILAVAAKLNKDQQIGQTDLFGGDGDTAPAMFTIEIPPSKGIFGEHEYLIWERELLGLYLSSHPLEAYDAFLSEQAVPLAEITAEADGKTAVVAGTINDIRQITTKNGQPMAFVKIEDILGDERELVVFPTVFKDTADLWNREKILLVTGKVNGVDRSGTPMQEAKILVDSARNVPIDEARAYQSTGVKVGLNAPKARVRKKAASPSPSATSKSSAPKRLYIRLSDASDSSALAKLKLILDDYHGDHEAVLVLGGSDKQIIKLPQRVTESPEMLLSLQKLIGNDQVKFQ